MAKVLGVGGVFFKSDNPTKLRDWYSQWLGLDKEGPGVSLSQLKCRRTVTLYGVRSIIQPPIFLLHQKNLCLT